MQVIYQNKEFELREISLSDYIEIPIYGDQREINTDRVNELADFQYQLYKQYNKFEFLSPPLIAIHPDRRETFIIKKINDGEDIKSDEVLFDGQHRQQAFKELYNRLEANNPFINIEDVYENYKIIVICHYCIDNNDIHQKFINVNKSISASGMELQANKQSYNPQKILNIAIKRFIYNKTYFSSSVELVKKSKMGTFYHHIFNNKIICNLELTNLLTTHRIKFKELLIFFRKLNEVLYDKIMNKANTSVFSGRSQAWRRDLNSFIKKKETYNSGEFYIKYFHPNQYEFIISLLIELIQHQYNE